jgi:hypothetical protein
MFLIEIGQNPKMQLRPSTPRNGKHTGSGLKAVEGFLDGIGPFQQMCGSLLKEVFPSQHQKLQKSFKAHCLRSKDRGPWLGKTLLYGVQTGFHFDAHDGADNASASWSVGEFVPEKDSDYGTAMVIAQLGLAFR